HDLRRILAERYRKLRKRLSFLLGSQGLADEALHETWLRLDKGNDLGPIANEEAYLIRTAMNLASTIRTKEEKRADTVTLDSIEDEPDESPDALRVADGKRKMETLLALLEELPPRQSDVFLGCFIHGETPEAMAEKHGVSLRTIQTDLRAAVFRCARRLGRKDVFADREFKVSR
ncbi:RNA polymerase sigma factor, partial [Escherichia coli]|nr:RNA polymerase sigma factor [Escherichia coli]